jgi:peptidoglycan/xylan/chitin deacetylase (PgdA/CDA1 family)
MLATFRKHYLPRICSWVPLDLWHRFLELNLLLPYYHMVSDRDVPHVSGLFKFRSVRQFEADMQFFLRSYTPVSLQDVIRHLDGASRLPKRCFLLTFDDGFAEVYDVVAPILFAHGIPAAFFLTTCTVDNRELCYQQKISLLVRAVASLKDSTVTREVARRLANARLKGTNLLSCLGNISYRQRHVLDELGPVVGCDFGTYAASAKPYLTSAQIKHLMGRGFAIGAHSVDHPLYSALSVEEQLIQTHESLNWLSNHFQYECQAFAFPFNDSGVSPEFFQKAFAGGRLKVSFGTGGMHSHFFRKHLNRHTMEFPELDTAQIVGREFAVTLFRRPPR